MSSFDPKFTIASIITEDLTTIERAHGFVEAAALSKEWKSSQGEMGPASLFTPLKTKAL